MSEGTKKRRSTQNRRSIRETLAAASSEDKSTLDVADSQTTIVNGGSSSEDTLQSATVHPTLQTDANLETTLQEEDLLICVGGGEKFRYSSIYSALVQHFGAGVEIVDGIQAARTMQAERNLDLLYVHGSLIIPHEDMLPRIIGEYRSYVGNGYASVVLMRTGDTCSQIRDSQYPKMLESNNDYNSDIGAYIISREASRFTTHLVCQLNHFNVSREHLLDDKLNNPCAPEKGVNNMSVSNMWLWGGIAVILVILLLILIIFISRRR